MRTQGTASPTPDPPSVLVTMPSAENPAADRVRMLEHELAFQTDLDSSWAVRPIALLHLQGRPALVYRLFGTLAPAFPDFRFGGVGKILTKE